MKNLNIKKIMFAAGVLVVFFSFFVPTSHIKADTDTTYTVLAPLPGTTLDDCTSGECKTTLQKYLPGLFKLLIGLSAVTAVLMIVWGGVQYITTDALKGKQEGKERLQSAIIAFVLVAGSYLILETINPNLLEINLNVTPAEVQSAQLSTSVTLESGLVVNLNTTDQLRSQVEAEGELRMAGFDFSSSGNCNVRTNGSCTSVDQMHSDTITGLAALKMSCADCDTLVITGGTETGHAEGTLSHESGFKADISSTKGDGEAFEAFIGQVVKAELNTTMETNGFYTISISGFTYQVHPEGDHMDIVVKPK